MNFEVSALVCLVGAITMTIVGWFVQLVQYPMLRHLAPQAFHRAHRGHTVAIGVIVVPCMVLESVGMVTTWSQAPSSHQSLALWGLVTGSFAILWTFVISAPLHGKLSQSFDLAVVDRLILTNLPRTLAWTAHAAIQTVIVLALLTQGRA